MSVTSAAGELQTPRVRPGRVLRAGGGEAPHVLRARTRRERNATGAVAVADGDPQKTFDQPDPNIYGLDTWADGIDVSGRTITMTAAMLMSAIPGRAALWNDSQAFELDGTITRCNADALCAHLGLDVGDRVEIDPSDMGLLPAGEVIDVTVHRVTGPAEYWLLQQGEL